MKQSFKEISFPSTFKYSSDSEHIPLEFYNEAFPISKKIDLFLGYFSSNAIKVLSNSFAEFVVNGGHMRIISNHVFSLRDKENLIDYSPIDDEDKIINIIDNVEKLEYELRDYGKHFFDCLKYLQKKDRLIIQPVKFNDIDLAHCKIMILNDGENIISTDGSINFTLSALTKNAESFEVNVPWENDVFRTRVENEIEKFENVFSGKHPDYKHLASNDLEVVINKLGSDKNKRDLLEDSISLGNNNYQKKVREVFRLKKIRFKQKIKSILNTPKFPFSEGPREYQVKAYKNWIKNNCNGLFAMATGTGKTITSLNCVIELYKGNSTFRVIITVPAITLVEQWSKEAKKFNLTNIIATSSNRNWERDFSRILFNISHRIGDKNNYVFITTYSTFNKEKCQKLVMKIKDKFSIFIADEVHNLGAKTSLKNLPFNIPKRIGLSATPERIYDEGGSNKLNTFFNSIPPSYTFKFSMKQAIDNNFLTKYYYYPYFVKLEHQELENYLKITRQLIKFFDFKEGKFKDSANRLLIKRKRIIHKAKNKKDCLRKIFKDVELKNESLKYTFVYVPEGYDRNENEFDSWQIEEEDQRIINHYSKIINDFGYKTHQFLGGTKGRERILNQFENGDIDIITAMKALDEGVDIPITKNAIFCASTGNPRQFIQRRGRVLRLHKNKSHYGSINS